MEVEEANRNKTNVKGGREDASEEIELKAMQDLRFKTVDKIKLQVLKGKVEYCGIEITDYNLLHELDGRGSLFTWKGCTIIIYGKLESSFIGENKVMALYANLHVALNKFRTDAKVSGRRGPVIMLAGPSDTGKSSVCRLLLNYAVQTSWNPIFVDVDVGQNDISMPAAIGATMITQALKPNILHNPNKTLIYAFGHTTPSNNIPHYHHIISKLADAVDKKMRKDPMYHNSGVVINTCGWVTGGGFQSLLHIAKSFKVDRVVVLRDTDLSTSLSSHLPTTLLLSSSAVLLRSKEERYESRQDRLHSFLFNIPIPNSSDHLNTPNIQPLCSDHQDKPSNIQPLHLSHLNPNSAPFIPANVAVSLNNNQPLHPSFNNQPHQPSLNNQPSSHLYSSTNKLSSHSILPNPSSIHSPSLHPSSIHLPSIHPFSLHPPIYQVPFNIVKVFMLNDNSKSSQLYRKRKLSTVRLTNQHCRMVVALADSPDHLANRPIKGIGLILEVERDWMMLMTSCASRPSCLLLMPSLHYHQPIPSPSAN